jgi:hypothetical protein
MATYKVKYGDTLSGIARANGTSVQALIKANPSITNPNVIRAGASLNLGGTNAGPSTPTPQPTPTKSTTPAPTIAEKASLIPDTTKQDPAIEAYYREQKQAMENPIDEKAMRDEIRKRYNDQFESLRLAAAQKIAGERKIGEGRLGSARALQARSGTLGSNFAGAENDQVNRDTEDIVNSINNETDAKIAFLMGESEKDYSAQIAAAREAKKKGADEYIKYLETRDSQRVEKANNLAKLFASQGIDPSTLSPADVKKLEDTYGVDLGSFKTMIIEQKNKINKDAFFELGDGQSRYVYDPLTGEAKLIAENTKNFAPNKYSSGGGGSSSGGGSRSSGGGGGSTGLSYDDPNYLFSVIQSSKGGRMLTQSEAEPLTKMKRVVGQAEAISGLVQQANTGPIVGILRTNNPYDTKAQLIKAQVTALVPTLARGVYGEVGVLTDTDVERYTRTIASLKNTADVNKAVMAMTLDIASKSMAAQLEAMSAAGRDVSGFYNMYKDVTTRVNSLKGQLEGAAQASTSNPATDVKVKAKDGRIITVPQDKLGAALKAGYTQVK